jgi:hypothetical protein
MTLDPDRVQAVFLAALEHDDPKARLAVLERECGDDDALRRRVEALLIAFDQPDSLLDRPFIAPGVQVAEMSELGVDQRSDIYSLRVLLHEQLTGSTPLERARLHQVGYVEILRRIKEEETPRPSNRLSDSGDALASISARRKMEATKPSKSMRGELDWIVMRAPGKDRFRHYETAGGFARDVRNYLSGEPVEACPLSTSYCESKRPDGWNRSHAQSLLGGSLLGMKKYAEAEPHLLSGYEGLKDRKAKLPGRFKIRLTQAGERVVQLHDLTGRKEEAAVWRARLQPPPSQPEHKL